MGTKPLTQTPGQVTAGPPEETTDPLFQPRPEPGQAGRLPGRGRCHPDGIRRELCHPCHIPYGAHGPLDGLGRTWRCSSRGIRLLFCGTGGGSPFPVLPVQAEPGSGWVPAGSVRLGTARLPEGGA